MAHTPGRTECECYVETSGNGYQITDFEIVYCPLHQAAPELLGAVDTFIKAMDSEDDSVSETLLDSAISQARAAKAKATES